EESNTKHLKMIDQLIKQQQGERNRSELLSRLDSIFDGDLANGLHAMLYAEARENKLFQSPMQAPTQIQSQIQSQSQSQTQMQELDEYAKQSPKPGILESSSMDNFVIQSEDTPFSETHEESDVIDSSNTRTKGKVQSSSRSRAETTIKFQFFYIYIYMYIYIICTYVDVFSLRHDDEQDNEVPTYPVGNILSRSSKEIHSPVFSEEHSLPPLSRQDSKNKQLLSSNIESFAKTQDTDITPNVFPQSLANDDSIRASEWGDMADMGDGTRLSHPTLTLFGHS
ncbi:hypothetical protein RFI_39341, partial [Reticulomyxa filosa]